MIFLGKNASAHFLVVVACILSLQTLQGGRFNIAILDSCSPVQLAESIKGAAAAHPFHAAVVRIQGRRVSGEPINIAGVYIGNCVVLTAAHCLKACVQEGMTAHFTTYEDLKQTTAGPHARRYSASHRILLERPIDCVKVAGLSFHEYQAAADDHGVIILERDPVGVRPAQIWTLPCLPLPSKGILISPCGPLMVEKFNGHASEIQRLPGYEALSPKHAVFCELFSKKHLDPIWARWASDEAQALYSSLPDAAPWKTLSAEIHGGAYFGDSGSPVFIESDGQHYVVGLITGTYGGYQTEWKAYKASAHKGLELYMHVGKRYAGVHNSISAQCRAALEKQIVVPGNEKKKGYLSQKAGLTRFAEPLSPQCRAGLDEQIAAENQRRPK